MPIPPIIASALRRSKPDTSPPPNLRRLLAGEALHALRTVVQPAVLVPMLVVAATLWVLLGPATPGFVLDAGWRAVLAIAVAVPGAVFAHGLLRRTRGSRASTAAGGIAVVVLIVGGALLVATVLAIVAPTLAPVADLDDPAVLSARLPIDPVLAVAGVLLVIAIVASAAGRRLRMPTSLLFLVIGMVAGADTFGLVTVNPTPGWHHLAVAALVLILFDGGVATKPEDLRRAAAPGALLATLGVVVSTAIVAGLALLLLPIDAHTAWLIGAVVAPTDAAALVALLRQVHLPRRIEAILTVESGGNDPMAVLLTVGILASLDGPIGLSTWTGFLVLQLIGGIVVGTAGGWVGARLVERVRLPSHSLYPVLALAVAVGTYGVAALLGASGLLAAYLCGIGIARWGPHHRVAIQGFAQGVATTVEVGLFLLLGLLVDPEGLAAVLVPATVLAVIVLVVARPLATLVSLVGLDLPWRDVGVVAWLGVRGAVPIILAIQALTTGLPAGPRVFGVVFVVVCITLVVQALSGPAVVRWLDPAPDELGTTTIEFVTAADVGGLAVLEAVLDGSSRLAGATLATVPPPRGVRVLSVRRNSTAFVPDGASAMRAGDTLVLSVSDQPDEARAVRRWLGHEV